MVVEQVKAVYLGMAEKEASGEKRAWSALDYVVVGENASRRTFIDRNNTTLLNAARQVSNGKWGSYFYFSGEVSQSGQVAFTALYPDAGEEVDF